MGLGRWWHIFKCCFKKAFLGGMRRLAWLMDSGCEQCGATGARCREFRVPDEYWEAVTGESEGGGYLCFNCFFKLAVKKGVFVEGRDSVGIIIEPAFMTETDLPDEPGRGG